MIYLGEAELIDLLTNSLLAAFHGGRSFRSMKSDGFRVFQHNAALKGTLKSYISIQRQTSALDWALQHLVFIAFELFFAERPHFQIHSKLLLFGDIGALALYTTNAIKYHIMCIKQGIICYEWSCNLMTCDVMEETPESSGRTAWWGSQAVDSIATNTVSSFVMSITAAMIITSAWYVSMVYRNKLQRLKPFQTSKLALITQVRSYPECFCHTCSPISS